MTLGNKKNIKHIPIVKNEIKILKSKVLLSIEVIVLIIKLRERTPKINKLIFRKIDSQ
jgi:hypothetical protein